MAPRLATLDEAIAVARALGRSIVTGTETVALSDACSRTVAVTAVARQALPSFRSSAMDGFAVRSADLVRATSAEPVELPIVSESRAGAPAAVEVEAGQAVRIATGAVVPSGADAVVPYEVVQQAEERVRFSEPVAPQKFVRAAGVDIASGDPVIETGTMLQPHHLAPLAGLGFTSVEVRCRPRVSVLLTGDEVVRAAGPDCPLPAGKIHDVSGVVVPALLRSWGAEVVDIVAIPDDRAATREAIADANGDFLVVCGGLSMGPHDHVRPALEALGARQDLFRVALQPGKPTWMGALPGNTEASRGRPVFGLPGNPVSVFVTASLLVRAAIVEATGERPSARLKARLAGAVRGLPDRLSAQRARLWTDEQGHLVTEVLPGQQSHLLAPLAQANGLALIPPGSNLPSGAVVEVVPIAVGDLATFQAYDRG